MLLFEIATSLPLLLTGLAALWGGVWGWLALGYITVLVFTLDRLIAGRTDNPDPEAEFPVAAMTLNAPRHSDHHVTPQRPYPALHLTPATMPILPGSLPVLAALALVPPLWRRVMDPLAARWRESSGGNRSDLAG